MSNAQLQMDEQIRPYVKRNMATSFTDGVLNAAAAAVVPFQTVIVYFVSDYVHSNLAVGLLSSVQMLLMAVPQFFVARTMEQKTYYKGYMARLLLLGRTTPLLLAGLILFLAPGNRLLFVVFFYLVYWLNGLWMGGVSITYANFIYKVIPSDLRGRFFGIRGSLNGLGGIAGSLVAGVILTQGVAPGKYAGLFLLAYALDMLSFLFLISAFEPRGSMFSGQEPSGAGFGRKLRTIVRQDHNFVKYLITQSALVFALATMSFQTLYAKGGFGLGSGALSILTGIIYASQMIGFVIWGFLADKFGFKPGMLAGYSLYAANLLLVVLVHQLYAIYLGTALFGIANSAHIIGNKNFIFNICALENRPAYTCIANLTVIPVSAAAPLLNGLMYDRLGFQGMCLVNLWVVGLGLAVFHRVKEQIK